MKNLVFCFLLTLCFEGFLIAQPSPIQKTGVSFSSFIDYQRSFTRPEESFRKKEDTLQKQFEAKGLKWPANYIYIRSFKYDSQLEIWVKDAITDPFKLFKTYKVCALAGTLGPKRMEGDYQVPEGFYYINEFNPKSTYYLSLGINYPNLSDRMLSDSLRPGGDIYIHGSCVTVGCIPLTDEKIDEVYILAAHARNQGQDYIPVHIFPVRYNVPKSVNYLNNLVKDDPELKKFAAKLEDAFDYFDKYKQLPVIMIADKGDYLVNGTGNLKTKPEPDEAPKKREPVAHRERKLGILADAVHEWPKFPGGANAYTKYLEELGRDMVSYLPKGTRKAYVQVEFIVDKDGMPVNFKVLRGASDVDFIDELITKMEKMPEWQPAILNDKPVAKKMVQTIAIEIPQELANVGG
ncbi:MAG: L,D-transpeptidase family protein [Chitinophagaceae bacterium]|nr:L,D-transpeptidase family protein [Chitinophagaceae bacterium]